MVIFSLADCCRMLAIDPKTLRRWLERSHLSVQPHPLDARLKCVSQEQVHQVAVVHRRILSDAQGPHLQLDTPTLSPPTGIMSLSAVSCVGADDGRQTTDLSTQLADLQTQITTLQHHLALLTGQLQQEQDWRTSAAKMVEDTSLESSQDTSLESSQDKSPKSSQDKSPKSSQDKSLESSQDKSPKSSQDKSPKSSQDKSLESSQDKSPKSSQDKSLKSSQDKSPKSSPSMDRRKHPHVLPLVEYGVQGTYVVISPEHGMLSFQPDSPEWFAWLETLPSFRFVGQHGRFTAFRGYQCSPSTPWWAHRQIRNHSHKRRLGTTASVTIEGLELAATSLQALV